MSRPEHVWVRCELLNYDETDTSGHHFCVERIGWVEDEVVRTVEDFRDPLDEAIVVACTWYVRTLSECGAGAKLTSEHHVEMVEAVKAKLDAQRPKTPEAVIEGAIESTTIGDNELRRDTALDIRDALVAAGFLPDSKPKSEEP